VDDTGEINRAVPPPLAWLGGAQVKILLGAAIDSG
jgi:hypothetical protein